MIELLKKGPVWMCFGGGGGGGGGGGNDDDDNDPGFFDDGGAFESFFDDIGLDVDGDAADGVSGGVANLGDTDGDGRGEFAFTDNASDEDRSNVESGDVGLAGTITNVSGNITDTPVDTGSSDRDSGPTFSEAFAAARAAQGPGGVFTWQGQQYSTNTAEEEAAAPEPEPEPEEEYGEDYTPTAEELAAQLEEAGLESVIPDPLSVEEQVQQYEDPGFLGEYEFDGETYGGSDLVDFINELEADLSASEVMGEMEQSGALDDTILGTGEGGLQDPDPGLAVGDPMTPQLAAELGIGYFEGDTLQSADIEDLRDLGFDVDESTIVGSLQGTIGRGDIVYTADDLATLGVTTREDAVAALEERIGSIYGQDVSAAEAAATLGLILNRPITDAELDSLLPNYQFYAPDPGTQLLMEGSGAFTTEMTGNLLTALGDLDRKTLEALGYDFKNDETLLSVAGESVRATGQEMQEDFLQNLQTNSPETYEAFTSPIIDAEGNFNTDALVAKALYSSVPTLAGLSGIPFGFIPAAVTGGLMTAGEIGTEARNEAYDQALKDARAEGLSAAEAEEYAESIGRSANLLGAALGIPVGAASNMLLGTVLKPGAGAQQVANMTAAMLMAAVDEGYIEQNTIQTAVNAQFEGAQGVGGTDISINAFSPDEFILGGLTGGVISVTAYAKAKASGMSDQEISQQIQSTPEGETVTLKDSKGAIIEQGAVPVSDIMFSGNPIEMRTAADGSTSIVDTVTGASTSMPAGTTLSSGSLSGTETTMSDLLASEMLMSGDNISIGQDANGNITLTDNDTGLTTNVEGDLFYDAFGNMYESAQEAQNADASYGLTGSETTVSDLQATEDATMGGLGTNVTIDSRGDTIELTNESTGLKVSIPTSGNVNIVNAVSSVQNNDLNAISTSGGTVVSVGTGTSTLTGDDVQTIVDNALAGLPDTASPEDVSTAISDAIANLEDLSTSDVESIVDTAIGNLENISSEDVESIVNGAIGELENISSEDVKGIVNTALETVTSNLENTLNTRVQELEDAGNTRQEAVDTALAELSSNLGTTEQTLLDQLGTTASELQAGFESQLEAGLGGLENTLNTRIGELEAAGVDRASAVDEVFAQIDTAMQKLDNSIRPGGSLEQQFGEDLNSVESSLIERIQELEASGTERSDAISQIVSELGQSMDSFEESSKAEFESLENQLSAKIERLEAAGLDRETALSQALSALSAELQTTETSILDRLAQNTAELLGYQTDVQKLETNINTRIGELEASGVDRASAVDTALAELSSDLGTTEQALLDQLGTTASELQAGFETGLSDLEGNLNDRIQELEDAGATRQEAVDQALSELSSDIGATEESLLTSIGETRESILQSVGEDISNVETTLTEQILALEDAGATRAEAVDTALSNLSSDLGTTKENLLLQIGQTEQSLTEQVETVRSDVEQNITNVESTILNRVQELEEAGMSRDQALQEALNDVSSDLNTTTENLLNTIGTTEQTLMTQLSEVETGLTQGLTEVSEAVGTSNLTLAEILAVMEDERRREEEYLASLEGTPDINVDPDYVSAVADTGVISQVGQPEVRDGIAAAGIRPTVAPYYQPQQTGIYSFYRPEPGVNQATPAPVFNDPVRYLAPTSDPLYGYGYIAPNMDIARMTRLAAIQNTGAEQLASEDLMDNT